jgi:uncharacterized membrane protein YfcA
LLELISLLLLGIFSGFMAGLLGVGGGLIIVPALLYLLAGDVEQSILMQTVIGTALATIVFTSLSSVWAHHRHGAIYWHYFIKLTPSILLGAFFELWFLTCKKPKLKYLAIIAPLKAPNKILGVSLIK